jgi:CheY-like chemotaxis protein
MPRVLVVDDDPSVCAAIRLWLEAEGFDVTATDGSSSGLQALEQKKFDVMIIDIFMPGMRGFESVRTFHQRALNVPLIAISGYAFASALTPAPDFLRMTLELGATRCLRKPFKPTTLLAMVRDCLTEAARKPVRISAVA